MVQHFFHFFVEKSEVGVLVGVLVPDFPEVDFGVLQLILQPVHLVLVVLEYYFLNFY